MPRKETYAGPLSAQAQQDLVSEGIENFELPKSVVMKIAKSAIPENVKLQKETVLSLVKGSTVFINYLAATAHDVAQSKQHKSISASDVLKALETIEFSDMVNKLQGELLLYRDLSKNDKGKKGSSNGASSGSARKPSGGSISAPPRTKGKEKVTTGNPMPGPFTTAPLGTTAAQPMDVDEDEGTLASASAAGRGGEVDPNDPQTWDSESDVAEEETFDETEGDEEQFEELEDTVALEEIETHADARGVEEQASAMDDADD
ncbi:histone-fold-containing protein [Pholiota conissans]|uniref:DNA polymerase epsilon subunit D n=1 Tax=Pholiota conissans TaxID=109636 RepID=A0A9P5YW82_9AGAR|nr:histone-fold-containing protein [Pholiota conissans]